MRELRPFWPYVKQEAKLYLLGFIGSLFRFLIPLTAPLMIKYIFDQLLPNTALSPAEKTGEVLAIAAGLTAIFLLLRAPMEYVRQYAMHKANNNIIQALRKAIFAKIHALDAKYFTDNKSGQIGARFFDDVEKARGFMTAVFANVGIELIVLGFVVTVMAVLNIELALLSVLLVGCQFAVAHLLAKRFKTSTSAMIGYRSVLSGFIFEKIQGAFLAKLFTADARDRQQLDGHLQTYEGLTDKHAKINALMLSSVNVLSDLTPVLVVLAGSLFVIQGDLTAGGLIAFFAYVDKLRSPVAALVQAFPAITEGSIALQRIFEFLRLPIAIRNKESAVAFGPLKGSIQFDRVTFGYEERRKVLLDVSFTLRAGKTYAFVGESGGGKSTILQLLLRLYDVSQGEVRLDGVNIKDYTLSSLRHHMGIVTQDNFLYSTSIKDNIKLAMPEATDEEVVAAARKAYAHDFITALPDGYETEIGERGIKLSGGQKQRLALARVFLKDPSVILLDEATSALDNESEQLVQQSIHELAKDKTVIMIAHRLSTIVHADTIFVVKDGKIAESGSHQSLLALGGYYKELYAKQQLPATPVHPPALKLASGQA